MLFGGEKVLGFFEIQFVGSPRSPPLTGLSMISAIATNSSSIILTACAPYSMLQYRTITCSNTHGFIQHWASGEGNKKKEV